ncbi:MAG: MFS transporter [Calditrichia bacterium]
MFAIWTNSETGERREGMFGSIYWWMVKLGMSLAFGLSGYLLNATGFDVEMGGAQTAYPHSSGCGFLMWLFPALQPVFPFGQWHLSTLQKKNPTKFGEQLEARRDNPLIEPTSA